MSFYHVYISATELSVEQEEETAEQTGAKRKK